ncbi:MAG: RpiB/LacA/LacB family sugar-phosphate isomerase [Candidatus Woesearchaeota archaeon]
MKKVLLGSDHAGFDNKEYIKIVLEELQIPFEDVSPTFDAKDDYPDVAKKLSKQVVKEDSSGILLCGTGIGVSIAANKIKGIRAALVFDEKTAELAKSHNHANILVLSGTLHKSKIKPILLNWFRTKKSLAARHLRRLDKID